MEEVARFREPCGHVGRMGDDMCRADEGREPRVERGVRFVQHGPILWHVASAEKTPAPLGL